MRSPVSPFSYVNPDVSMKRSQFRRPFRHLTTLSAGLLYPIMCDEVLPGDTYSVDVSALIRMSTPIHPVMDNCFIDLAFFYCPSRILWTNWKSFMGESPEDPYINPVEYSVPQLKFPAPSLINRSIKYKTVADYMGLPAGSIVESVNALPFRGFAKIWNEWYRDQNLQDAIDIDYGDQDHDYAYSLLTDINWVIDCAYGGGLPPVNKFHDYFTSALLQPQKGEAVPIPLSGFAPVYANNLIDLELIPGSTDQVITVVDQGFSGSEGVLGADGAILHTDSGVNFAGENIAFFNNLGGDLSNIVGTYATINDLRYAFQLQKFLERDAFGGTRYRELLLSHFGVTSPDATQQVPEFLGAKRIPINMSQVLQTSATNDVSPQGNTAAYSLTQDSFNGFTKSFTEHGYLYCVACIRTEHTYQQGLERMWLRKDKFDFYWPEFANISFQPIYNKQIYNPDLQNNFDQSEVDEVFGVMNEIFGYQEPWAEYRYKPNRVSGEFRSSYPQSLDVWHYADDYSEQPYLSDEWIRETRENVDRTLAVTSNNSDQFIADFYFQMDTTRVMPVTSRPGLADHH